MKNFLISILCIGLSFTTTYFCLQKFVVQDVAHNNQDKVEIEESFNDQNELEGSEVTTEEDIPENLTEENNVDDPLTLEDTIDNDDSDATTSSDSAFADILVDYKTWKKYHKENIDLSTNFIAVDANGKEITKKKFLQELKTGAYIPVKLFDAAYMYQLYKIGSDKEKISKSIKSSSSGTYKYFLKEGTPFPSFDVKDLNGNLFSNKNTLGNILVIKCWFIQCRTCVAEFPIINDLYDRYEGHDDVVFLSLAFDKPDKLKKFLSKKEFRYPVVPEQKKFIKDDIGIIQYPAHIIVDKYGNIHKIVNNVDSMISALDLLANGEINVENDF